MNIFFTQSTHHLIQKDLLPSTSYIFKKFSDGELYIKIQPTFQDKAVWVVTSTQPPAENLLELFLLLDALYNTGVQNINLLFSYFGYARQTAAQPGEARSAEVITKILNSFSLHKIYSIHTHAALELQSFFSFQNIINMDFFCHHAQSYDIIAAPDKGAAAFAQEVAQRCNKDLIILQKKRPQHEEVIIEAVNGNVNNKKVLLVDDMIATGRTLVEASMVLLRHGAQKVSAAATHGVFSNEALERLNASSLHTIYVTNSLPNHSQGKIEVTDIKPFIKSFISPS